ncbi:uncharacterized protein F54F2.9 [Arctopsyche grandis]|uniref:uncharacterized protein F54F2.9 n=1 Tax=Arctopsyche grandis TaxID=121162 RepID=UPI00406D6504
MQMWGWAWAGLLSLLATSAFAWDNDDMEVFDAVEEVNQNFYQFMGVVQDATSTELRVAYRNLTLKLHPDKNDSPDADEQFRNLVSIYNILKDPGKREKYNDVLKNGLPNWRSAVYYYRHVRKMGLIEMSIILFIIISIGQYVVGWSAYAEKRYFTEQILGTKLKKIQKKSVRSNATGGDELMDLIAEIPTPSVRDTLPWQITRLFIWIVTGFPHMIKSIPSYFAERRRKQLEEKERLQKEEERLLREEEEAAREKEARGLRRRRHGFKPPERTGADDVGCFLEPVDEPEKPVESKPTPVSGGLWTDDDLAELVRLVKKYPSGTSGRWERIADTMCRNVSEITHMAAKLKENCYRVPGHENTTEEIPGLEITKKVKTKGGRMNPTIVNSSSEAVWSQVQQKALENALAKYPRGGASDRWDKIAKSVPDKTKEECMLRYKYLADILKKQKLEESGESAQTDQPELCDITKTDEEQNPSQ